MYAINPERIDLAQEFKATIYGRHSGELQRVLNRMRGGPMRPLCHHLHQAPSGMGAGAHGQRAGDAIEPVPSHVFRSEEEAEWAVFKLRWRELTGRDLPIE